MGINFDDFEIIKSQPRGAQLLYVTIAKDGKVGINSTLLKTMDTSGIEIYLSKNGKQLAIRNGGEFAFKIPKAGYFKNYDICTKLAGKKIKLPAYYVGEWDEENNWLGDLTYYNPRSTKNFPSKL